MSNLETDEGTSAPISADLIELNEQDPTIPQIRLWRRVVGRCALALCLATGFTAVETAPAHADTGGYPNAAAALLNAENYDWWVDENGNGQYNSGETLSPRDYAYRNCTDWAAWRIPQLTGINVPGNWGNAQNWEIAATAAGKTVDSTPEAGDIAVWDDGYWGHVAVVESVNPLVISEYNGAGDGNYRTRTNPSGIDHFIDMNGTGVGINGGGGGPQGGPETIGIYDPVGAVFHERNSNTPGPADMPVPYGNSNWIPLAGDWNNDKVFTPGAYDPNTGTFYLSNSNVPGGPPDTPAFTYGNIGWKPIAGDWDGNGYWSIGMYDPNTATFYLRNNNSSGPAEIQPFQFGNIGWDPITGDWDGHDDGNPATTIGVYNPNTATYYLNNENDNSAAEKTIQYGNIGWKPIAGDWDGNGFSSIGAYDPSTSRFYLRNSNTPGPAEIPPFTYGNVGWKPIVGDWDGQ